MKKFMLILLLSTSPRMLAMQAAVEQVSSADAAQQLHGPEADFFATVLTHAQGLSAQDLITFCADEVQPAYNAKETEFQQKAAGHFAALRSTLAKYIQADRLDAITAPFYRLNADYETLFNQIEKKPAGTLRWLTFRSSSTVGELDSTKAALIKIQSEYRTVITTQAELEKFVHGVLEVAIEKAQEPSALQATLIDLRARADALFASLNTQSIFGYLFGSRDSTPAPESTALEAVAADAGAHTNNDEAK